MTSIPYGFLVHFIALLAYGVAAARADITIGAPYPATGPNSWLGSPTKVGIERAVHDQNNSKDKGLLGQRLAIIWENDRCDSDQAVTAARKLINSKKNVAVVIGHQCSGAALSAAPLYNDAELLLISSFATNPKVTESGWPLVFRVNGRDDQQSKVAAELLSNQFLGVKVAIVHDSRAYGKGLAELMLNSLSEVNITPVKIEEIKPDASPSQYSEVVGRMRNADVGVIYYAGYSDVGGMLRRLSWEEGLRVPMLAGDGILSEDFRTIAGPDAAGMILTTNVPDPRNREEAAEVVAAIHEQDNPVFPQTLHAYAAVQAWVQAVTAVCDLKREFG